MSFDLFLANGVWLLGFVTILWIVSVVRRDVSIVDPFWSLFFLLVSVRTAYVSGVSVGGALVLACVGLWSIRLALHLGIRTLRSGEEDPRYREFRRRFGEERYWWVSFFQVFLLQGTLALVISLPLQLAIAKAKPALDPWMILGVLVFAFGFFVEAFADAQLARHRGDASQRGKVLDTGLWRYSRHPNYFGESVLGWGFWIMSLSVDASPLLRIASVLAPIAMTYLLLRVSGVTLLEQGLKKSKPGYEDYIARTSSFILWPPKARRSS